MLKPFNVKSIALATALSLGAIGMAAAATPLPPPGPYMAPNVSSGKSQPVAPTNQNMNQAPAGGYYGPPANWGGPTLPAEQWQLLRELRNQTAHEYPEQPQLVLENLRRLVSHVPTLEQACQQLADAAQQRIDLRK